MCIAPGATRKSVPNARPTAKRLNFWPLDACHSAAATVQPLRGLGFLPVVISGFHPELCTLEPFGSGFHGTVTRLRTCA